MAKVKIFADSTCDLPVELIRRHEVEIVPLYVTLGTQSLADGVAVTPEEIYRHFEQTKETPKTSGATAEDFRRAFEPHAKQGRDLVFIGLSSQMSTTMDQACLAARDFPGSKICCIDSRNLSTGIGLSVLHACELAEQGCSAEEIQAQVTAMTARVRASFVLDSMSFLYHGGRCSAVQAYGATLLRIKPQISVVEGAMQPTEKYRGSFSHVAKQYAERILMDVEKIDPKRVFITYSQGTQEDVIDSVHDVVAKKNHFQEILHSTAGCVITSHCGRNTIGVLFVERPEA